MLKVKDVEALRWKYDAVHDITCLNVMISLVASSSWACSAIEWKKDAFAADHMRELHGMAVRIV